MEIKTETETELQSILSEQQFVRFSNPPNRLGIGTLPIPLFVVIGAVRRNPHFLFLLNVVMMWTFYHGG